MSARQRKRLENRWETRPVDDEPAVRALAAELKDLPLALARALILRGVTTFELARKFFRPGIEDLHDPFLMTDMEPGAERLAEAVLHNEKVLVYGDYDVDGVTSTAMMTSFLRSVGVETHFFIPDRSIHGYGLCNAGFDYAVQNECSLVVALDCGITAIEPARYAKSLGLDLIICDHHTATDEIPDAIAVLDPKRPDCSYPYPHLSGCGVGFKLIQAASSLLNEEDKVSRLLDLVAISIAADIVPISGENRVLMREGIALLQSAPRCGVSALAAKAKLDLKSCDTANIVFGIAPRINAAGRLKDAADAVLLLLEEDETVAERLAQEIEQTNTTRKQIDVETEVAAITMAEEMAEVRDRDAFVLYARDWHPGVIGITASRIIERFYRPTIMLTSVNGKVKGSARSIHGVNVYNALDKCSDLLIQFGGHDFAAGMQLEESNVETFRERFEEAVAEQLVDELKSPVIRIDSEIDLCEIDLSDVNNRFWAVLKQFGPFGPANSRPVFLARNLEVRGNPRSIGKTNEHLKFSVSPATTKTGARGPISLNRPIDVIGFGLADLLPVVIQSSREKHPLEVVFTIDENEYKGKRSLQLRLKDLRLQATRPDTAIDTDDVDDGNVEVSVIHSMNHPIADSYS